LSSRDGKVPTFLGVAPFPFSPSPPWVVAGLMSVRCIFNPSTNFVHMSRYSSDLGAETALCV